MDGESRSKVKALSWEEHVKLGHLPFRRDCRVCQEASATRAGAAGGFSSRVVRRAPWAGEFEVTGFSFHFRVCEYETNVFGATNQPRPRRLGKTALEAQDHEQSDAQVTYPGFLLTSTCEFEGAHRLSSFSKVHQDLSENGMSDIPPP